MATDQHVSVTEIIEALSSEKKLITTEANIAWGKCNFALSEPEIVKDFIMSSNIGIDYLNKTIANHFNKKNKRFNISFGGVFAHQRPYVKRLDPFKTGRPGTNPKEICELADLVLINVYLDANRNIIHSNASLFQAKKDEKKISNKTQELLYDYDHKFEYDALSFYEKTACGHGLRELPHWDRNRSTALQYLLLNSSNPLKTMVRQSPWPVDHKHEFGFYLYRMLTCSAGKPFSYALRSNGKWSSIIFDLLNMAAGIMRGKPRASGELDIIIDQVISADNNKEINEIDIGIPLIISIVQDKEYQLEMD